jgi:hypothetical protein
MALLTCGGADVLKAEIHLPARGAWWASVMLDTATAPSGAVTLAAADGISLAASVVVAGVFCDVAHVQLVGGAGGLGTILTPSAYEVAQLRDPLAAALKAGGEVVSSTVASSITGVQLGQWTLVGSTVSRALDELCGAAAAALGQAVGWRVLGDGSVWLGSETWPSASLPTGADLLEAFPAEGRYVIGADTPSLLPGVNLTGVGQVVAVDHWITHTEVRTWAWV